MHDCAFADSARQAPVKILGLPMLPYSIGHEILLLAQRNALLFHGFELLPATDQRAAIIRAVLICYRTWNQNQIPEKHIRLWGLLILRKADFPVEIASWLNYREAGVATPPAPTQEAYEIAAGVQHEDAGRQPGSPALARLLAYATRLSDKLGFETPYDMPYGMANTMYLSELEMDGTARIENYRELEERIAMARHRAEIEKERREKCQP